MSILKLFCYRSIYYLTGFRTCTIIDRHFLSLERLNCFLKTVIFSRKKRRLKNVQISNSYMYQGSKCLYFSLGLRFPSFVTSYPAASSSVSA
mmetsp:Transcript_13911/g.40704  ORF Transcript_13911/g.40704 Transcript_13911/m.40704 type:complete len:92 (+) Transcript_13911:64-339(+)